MSVLKKEILIKAELPGCCGCHSKCPVHNCIYSPVSSFQTVTIPGGTISICFIFYCLFIFDISCYSVNC